ncbi:MAG TPA: carboxypeptidase-like regulatory domain-containing protein [Terracidiphilus sp.]|nr:carboxypeptidase-like regulatory domain-containing protein [Terracidiphilus sp.]
MKNRKYSSHFVLLGLFLFLPAAWAQFSGTVTGTVTDPSGAVVPKAKLTLTNDNTGQSATATTNASGVYTFPSMAPGDYHITAAASGFANSTAPVVLQTNQVLNVPVRLAVGNAVQTVQVTTQSPLMDTADSRIQETIPSSTLSNLPLAGESMISLVMLAPGVTGTGVTSNGSPGSGRDNYSTETQVDASANGQGAVGNMYIVDGLDVTSSIRAGVLNLTPAPDSIQETSIQTNTYSVLYGRASSVEMTMTTKSGSSRYHGNAEDFFFNQDLLATTHFAHKYPKFHTDNISASIGGPVWPGKGERLGFFFFEIEPQLATNAVTYSTTFEDPAFTSWAKTNYPNTVGTKMLTSFPVSNVTSVVVKQTASSITGCGTPAASNIPCNLALLDQGNFAASDYRNASQYFIRGDKDFHHDRVYGTIYRTTLNTNGPSPRAAFNSTSKYYEWAAQANETHTFSPDTINEAAFGADRVEGISPATGNFEVPSVGVTGVGTGYGDGFAQGDFIQHNYHWRDMLTHLVGNHDLQAGFEGLFGDDVEIFNGPYDHPSFSFRSLLDLAEDNVYTEGSLAYNPLTGQRDQYGWNAAGATFGAFAQDIWKANRHLTVTYGLRWDDFGNPWSRTAGTAFSDFYLGAGQTVDQQVANGILIRHNHALARSITDVFSPRLGIAWDVLGNSNWLFKGGVGIFHNWPTLANLQEEYRGNPPGDIYPTFFGGQSPAPIFAFGTSNTKPYGFPAPSLGARTLNAAGGITGLQFSIGAVDPTLISPVTYTYSAGLSHRMGQHFVASADYSGANGRDLMSGGGQVYNVSYGQDINAVPGDLIVHKSTVPTRLNSSFGSILYTANDRVSNYWAFIAAVQGRFSRSFFNASYTRSSSWDDTQVFPSDINVHQWYGPSIWNAPNRFSLTWNYNVPNLGAGNAFAGRFLGGWAISGTAALQSGNPGNVYTNAPFKPNATYTGYAAGSGDFNADGDNNDYPDVASYKQGTSKKAFLTGIFSAGQFAPPATFGQEGNESYNRFVGPNFEEWDSSLLKNTKILESVQFQIRMDVFNVFNRSNFSGFDNNLANINSTFGQSTSQRTPRFVQIGGNLTF